MNMSMSIQTTNPISKPTPKRLIKFLENPRELLQKVLLFADCKMLKNMNMLMSNVLVEPDNRNESYKVKFMHEHASKRNRNSLRDKGYNGYMKIVIYDRFGNFVDMNIYYRRHDEGYQDAVRVIVVQKMKHSQYSTDWNFTNREILIRSISCNKEIQEYLPSEFKNKRRMYEFVCKNYGVGRSDFEETRRGKRSRRRNKVIAKRQIAARIERRNSKLASMNAQVELIHKPL